jgi:ferredoxin
VEYCPVEDCMFWAYDEDNPFFGRIQIDPILCIGCKKCLSNGPDGCFPDGCPWDAIVMVDIAEVEKEVGRCPTDRFPSSLSYKCCAHHNCSSARFINQSETRG